MSEHGQDDSHYPSGGWRGWWRNLTGTERAGLGLVLVGIMLVAIRWRVIWPVLVESFAKYFGK